MIPKKRLFSTAIFLVLLALLTYLIGLLLQSSAMIFDPNEKKVEAILDFKNENYDLICLGNSITQAGINPIFLDSILGINSFNFAVGGATIIESEIFLRHYLSYNKKPKYILYGLYVNDDSWGNDLRPSIRFSVNDNAIQYYYDYLENNNISTTHKKDLYNQFSVFRYRNTCEKMLKFIVDGKNRQYFHYKGFLYSNINNKIPKKLNPHESGINLPALRSFHTYCEKQNIRVIYVELPNCEVFNQSTLKRDQTIKDIQSVVGNSFISFNNQSASLYPEDCWVSLNHLNKKGAGIFTSILANELNLIIKDGFFLTSSNNP